MNPAFLGADGARPAVDASAEPVVERFCVTATGGILYDPARVNVPGDVLFEPAYWQARGALERLAGGRGSVALIHPDVQSGQGPPESRPEGEKWVLRHYRRGGLAARASADRYLWLGARRTRSFAEWRLLARLRQLGLPVPPPIAARYVRGRLAYRADLITGWLPRTRTLADAITGAALAAAQWRRVGETIARFHRQGVQHPDLNANNILLQDPAGEAGPAADEGDVPVYLLDFDRGRIRGRGAWEAQVLARLARSLHKIGRLRAHVEFTAADWRALLEGYESGGP